VAEYATALRDMSRDDDDRERKFLGALDDLAHWTRVFFLSLVEHGFDEREALTIVSLWAAMGDE
jgi:hypothetical protein